MKADPSVEHIAADTWGAWELDRVRKEARIAELEAAAEAVEWRAGWRHDGDGDLTTIHVGNVPQRSSSWEPGLVAFIPEGSDQDG